MSLTPDQLADWIINHDLEVQVIEGDVVAILEEMLAQGLEVTLEDVEAGVDLALTDPYIEIARRTLRN